MSRSKRRHRHAKPVQQTQSPACSSSPSPVTEPVRRHDRHKIKKRHKAKKRLPPSSQAFKKHGLNPESPKAGPSDPSITDHERAKPRSFGSSQVNAQEPGSSHKHPRKSLQRTPPCQVRTVCESEFEFEYKNPTQAKALLKSRLALRSPPSSPQKVVGLKNPTLVPDYAYGNKTGEVPSSDPDSESGRGSDPVSPSPSPPPSLQKIVDLKYATLLSDLDCQHNACRALLSNSPSNSHSVTATGSGMESALPSPALPERVVGHERTTPMSHFGHWQQTCEVSISDTDNESETASEARQSSEPELSSPIPSPCKNCKMTARKRKISDNHQGSQHKPVVPYPAPSSLECLPGFESEPTLPVERAWSTLLSLDGSTHPEPTVQNFRREHWRKACETKEPPSPSSSRLVSMIGSESPSKYVSETEYEPRRSESESRYPSPTQSTITPVSSPPVPPTLSRVRSRVLSSFPSPQRWLPRLERPDQETSLIPTVWASRLRHRCDIRRPEVPFKIAGKRFPRLFAKMPPGGHENIEFRFPDTSDDDPDFDDPNSKILEAKRRRLGLTEREESPSEARVSTNSETESEPESESEPEPFIDLGELLDLARSSNPEQLPVLERPSDLESENPHTPTSIRNELPVRQTRQLNKRIDEAVVIDKEQNPKYWGGSWMKEDSAGKIIKARPGQCGADTKIPLDAKVFIY
ncbi:hypothetical protein Pdw03_1463 [Penicillium digitatum]|uniref:Uncharacterized protein n=1 Tax=Penicillium digitatum TaxID=36651 RepID=A0A7T7BNR6_PENDI|nr:hypothetical protein Pdw03_1463 [Penicillium digitatum]